MEQSKKYSEMTYEEFLTEVLEFKLNEQQLHLVRMFEETKGKTEKVVTFRNGMSGDINTLLTATSISNTQGLGKRNGDMY